MSSIEELQQRVIEAEDHFGLINAERAKYSERLIGLIDAIETRLSDQQAEIERQAGESATQVKELSVLRQDSDENKLLRGMIQSLLNAIELGNGVALSETMQVLDTKISALIEANSSAEETAPSETEALEAAPQEIEAVEAEPTEAEPVEAEASDLESIDTPEEESDAPDLEAADPQPEMETLEAETETETAEPEAEASEPEAPAIEAAEEEIPVQDDSVPAEEEAAVEEPEDAPETAADVTEELEAAEEAPASPEPAAELESEVEAEVEAEAEAPEVMDMPAMDADVTMLDEELVIGAASDDVPSEVDEIAEIVDAVEENLVDEADAVLDVAASADDVEKKPEASSLEDIMRRVSKLVEDEGALGPLDSSGVHVEASASIPEDNDAEPAPEKSSASGG